MGDMDGDMDGDAILSGDMDGDDVLGAILSGDLDGDAILSGDMDGVRNPFRRRRNRKAALRKLIMAKKAQDGKLLKQLKPNKWRRQPLGFVALAVPAAGTTTAVATPQIPFRGQRLTVQASVGINFLINSLTVGRANQFAGTGAVSAVVFAENAVGEDMNLDTAQIGNTIALNITNRDAANPHDFLATLMGDAVDFSS